MQQVGWGQVQGGEDFCLQDPGPGRGGPDAGQSLGGAAVAHLKIGKPVRQRDHLVVEYPFVGIVDQLGLTQGPVVTNVGKQMDMLPHDLGDHGVAQLFQDAGAVFGMIVQGSQAGSFADIVKEGAGAHQGERQIQPGFSQGFGEKSSHLHDPVTMLPDVGEHSVSLH